MEASSKFIDILHVNHVKFKKEGGNNDSLFYSPRIRDQTIANTDSNNINQSFKANLF